MRPITAIAPPIDPPTMAPKREVVGETAVAAVWVAIGVLVEEVPFDKTVLVVNEGLDVMGGAVGDLVANAP